MWAVAIPRRINMPRNIFAHPSIPSCAPLSLVKIGCGVTWMNFSWSRSLVEVRSPARREWQDTCDTLHMWTQVVGKIRMALTPHVNHWWEVALYVSASGLTTSPIPYQNGIFEIEFGFLHHRLDIRTSLGTTRSLPLKPQSVADFYRDVMAALDQLGIA